jgi:predicted permease
LKNENPLAREITVPGYVPGPGEDMHVRQMQVYPGYFDAVGSALLAGRDLDERDDHSGSRSVVVINDTMARRFFGSPGSAVGRAVNTIDARAGRLEIVGVARDIRDRALREEVMPMAYSTFAQTPTGRGQMTLVVRVAGDPRTLASTIRQLAREADPTMAMLEVETLDDRVRGATRQEQLVAWLSSVFGGMAAVLAAIGLYGLLAYTVARRQVELGVRLALGASPGGLRGLVLRDSLMLVGAGLAAGLALAGAAAPFISRMLFGLAPLDPVSFGSAAVVLLAVAVVAAWVPARHASTVDPIAALRQT